MGIAAGILSLVFGLFILLQSFIVGVGGAVLKEESASQGGSVGILVSFLLIIAGAFAFKLPRVAMFISGAAGILGVLAGLSTTFKDMTVWGVVALALTALNYFAARTQKKKAEKSAENA